MQKARSVDNFVVFSALPTSDKLLAADPQATPDRIVEHAATFLRSDPDHGWEIVVRLVLLEALSGASHGQLLRRLRKGCRGDEDIMVGEGSDSVKSLLGRTA